MSPPTSIASPGARIPPQGSSSDLARDGDAEVLICGAGAAGLTLAIDLSRRGTPFRLIDKRDEPFAGSRGKGIQPRTQEIFEDLGVIDRIFSVGGPYPPQRLYRDDGSFEEADPERLEPTPAEPYQATLMVPQFLTERVLRERLAELGHAPEFGCELTGLSVEEDGVSARLARRGRDDSMRVAYLVGADGGNSFVRQALDIEFPGKTLGVRAIVADLVLTGLERDAWHRFNETSMGQQVMLCPLAGTEFFQLQAAIPPDGDVDLTAAGLTDFIAGRTGRDDIRVESVSWASAYRMNARLADRYRVGRAFLIGDAAHVHPPTGAQGLNTSVQDAYNLGWKLAAVTSGASDTLLDSYEQERRPVAAHMLGLSTDLLDALKRGQLRRGREVHQLDIGYAGSSLAFEARGEADGLLAGDRAPDALLRGAGGQPRRLHEVFKGAHWTLLGCDVERDVVPPRPGLHIHRVGRSGDLLDEGGHFSRAYGVRPGEWVLVRPDGYVGAIIASEHLEALERYLRDLGLAVLPE